MPSHFVYARLTDIAATTTKEEVEDFLNKQLPGCNPVVSPLIVDLESGNQVTTVIFQARNKNAGKKAVRLFLERRETLTDAAGSRSHIGMTTSCPHLTILERKSENPRFEYAH